jgi:transcriptional regulator with XRE-family HTH domain
MHQKLVIVVDIRASEPHTCPVSSIYMAFAQNMRALRQGRKLSQGDLGELCSISRATIASIEGCRQAVLLHQAVALAAALDVPLTQLIQTPLGELEELRGMVAEEDLQKILAMTKGLQ